MTAPSDILDQSESLRGAFLGALAIHAALAGAMIFSNWLAAHTDAFGAANAGGASVAIETVNSIPIPHQGQQNPLASDTDSQVPQAPPKPVERAKQEKPPPDAIPIKSRAAKKAEEASEKNKFRPLSKNDLNQIYSKAAPAVSNPAFAAKGAGNVNPGANNTLGNRCPAYSSLIQQLVASHWNTTTVDASVRTAPTIIATFDLSGDGTIHNIRLLQGSGISTLDSSVERAVQDSDQLPKIPPDCGRDHASVEFWFELKR